MDNYEVEFDYLMKISNELNQVVNIKTDRQYISLSCLIINEQLNKMLSNNKIIVPNTLYKTINVCLKYKIISKLEAKNINAVRRIRNKFEHTLSIRNFDDIDIINYQDFYIKENDTSKKDIFRVNTIKLMLIDTKREKGYFKNVKNKDVFTNKKLCNDDVGKSVIILFSMLNEKERKEIINHIVNGLFHNLKTFK
jgi:Fe2+ or Zn2+ uptake regulation protein